MAVTIYDMAQTWQFLDIQSIPREQCLKVTYVRTAGECEGEEYTQVVRSTDGLQKLQQRLCIPDDCADAARRSENFKYSVIKMVWR